MCDAEGFWLPYGNQGGGGLRTGSWLRSGVYTGLRGWKRVREGEGESGTRGRDGASEARAEDECPLVAGEWEWQPHACQQPSLTERDCEACWSGMLLCVSVCVSVCVCVFLCHRPGLLRLRVDSSFQ